jgi:hypothetical protein
MLSEFFELRVEFINAALGDTYVFGLIRGLHRFRSGDIEIVLSR